MAPLSQQLGGASTRRLSSLFASNMNKNDVQGRVFGCSFAGLNLFPKLSLDDSFA